MIHIRNMVKILVIFRVRCVKNKLKIFFCWRSFGNLDFLLSMLILLVIFSNWSIFLLILSIHSIFCWFCDQTWLRSLWEICIPNWSRSLICKIFLFHAIDCAINLSSIWATVIFFFPFIIGIREVMLVNCTRLLFFAINSSFWSHAWVLRGHTAPVRSVRLSKLLFLCSRIFQIMFRSNGLNFGHS